MRSVRRAAVISGDRIPGVRSAGRRAAAVRDAGLKAAIGGAANRQGMAAVAGCPGPPGR